MEIVGIGLALVMIALITTTTLGLLVKKVIPRLEKEKQNKINFKKRYDKIGLPVISVRIIDNYYDFILDTGANFNALDQDQFKRILKENNIDASTTSKGEGLDRQITITSVNGQQTDVKEINLNIDIAGMTFKEEFTVVNIGQALEHYNDNEFQLCGVLGAQFLEKNKWTLDFENLVVWTTIK